MRDNTQLEKIFEGMSGDDKHIPPPQTKETPAPAATPSDDNPLYVEYQGEMSGEREFKMPDGGKYQYVWAIYPGGKKDVGVYSFRGDIVYGYKAFRKMHGIDK